MNSIARVAGPDEVDLYDLADRLIAATLEARGDEQRIGVWLDACRDLTPAWGVAYLQRPPGGRWAASATHVRPPAFAQLQSLLGAACRLAGLAASQRRAQLARIDHGGPRVLLALPVPVIENRDEVLVVILDGKPSDTAVQRILLMLQLVTACRGLSTEAQGGAFRQRLARLLSDGLHQLAHEHDPRRALQMIVDRLPDLIQCQMVAVGVPRRRSSAIRLLAVSGHPRFDRNSELAGCLSTVLDEASLESSAAADPSAAAEAIGAAIPATSAAKQLCELTGARRITAHRASGQRPLLLLCLAAQAEPASSTVRRARQEAAVALDVAFRAFRPGPRYYLEQVLGTRLWDSALWRRVALACAALLVIVLFVVPFNYKVSTSCVVQPVKRRYVAMPYDGKLDAALVHPGDVVHQGQVLARMDAQEIEWKLAGLRAEYDRAQKQREAELANGNTASAQMARLEMERLDLEIRLLETQAENLEIKSPIDGIVISGDPSKIEGSRIQMGQTIVEIAPLDKMVVEVAIPDADIYQIAPGDPVRLRFSSLPGHVYRGHLQRIQLRAEQRDGQNVFIGDVYLDQADALLRPGMSGRAKIAGRQHCLAWNLFHKAWDRMRLFFAW